MHLLQAILILLLLLIVFVVGYRTSSACAEPKHSADKICKALNHLDVKV